MWIAIIYCRAHQKATDQVALGNNWADKHVKEAA
jgi:hypothetical protein